MVGLGKRVGDAKVIIEEIDGARCNIEGEIKAFGFLRWRGPNIYFNATFGFGGFL